VASSHERRAGRIAIAVAIAVLAPACVGEIVVGNPSTGGADAGGPDGGAVVRVDAGPPPVESLEDRDCPPESFLDYDNFGGPFFAHYCTGCHGSEVPADMRQGAPDKINFDSLEAIRQRAARIYQRAADDNATMPPAGGPPPEERRQLGDWLACGAPE
jgi:hypothetical protein